MEPAPTDASEEPQHGCSFCSRPPTPGCGTCARRELLGRHRDAIAQARSGASLRTIEQTTRVRRQSIAKALRRPPAEKVPNRAIREEIEHAIALSPELSFSEIARRADPPFASGTEVSRLLGRMRTAPKRVSGRLYPSRWIREISVENAARLIRAAGLDPVDFDDL